MQNKTPQPFDSNPPDPLDIAHARKLEHDVTANARTGWPPRVVNLQEEADRLRPKPRFVLIDEDEHAEAEHYERHCRRARWNRRLRTALFWAVLVASAILVGVLVSQ